MTTPDPTTALRDAQRHHEAIVHRWNALATPQARHDSGLNLDDAHTLLRAAAAALAADAAARHHLTFTVGVSLLLTADGRWTLDADHADQARLLHEDTAVDTGGCTGHGTDLDDECAALADAMTLLGRLPDASELAAMITDHNQHARTLPELEPDNGIDYWIAASGVKLHRFRTMRGGVQGRPYAWCGAHLIDQVRATVGQQRCNRCEDNMNKAGIK